MGEVWHCWVITMKWGWVSLVHAKHQLSAWEVGGLQRFWLFSAVNPEITHTTKACISKHLKDNPHVSGSVHVNKGTTNCIIYAVRIMHAGSPNSPNDYWYSYWSLGFVWRNFPGHSTLAHLEKFITIISRLRSHNGRSLKSGLKGDIYILNVVPFIYLYF